MVKKLTNKHIAGFTLAVTVLMWSQLLYQYLTDGVPIHMFLHREDMPSISNYWSGLILPMFTAIVLFFIQKKTRRMDPAAAASELSKATYGLIGGAAFGAILSLFFALGYSSPPSFMMLGAIVLSFFLPIYKPANYLGFVLGMTYLFGATLPIVIGLVLFTILRITYFLAQMVKRLVRKS